MNIERLIQHTVRAAIVTSLGTLVIGGATIAHWAYRTYQSRPSAIKTRSVPRKLATRREWVVILIASPPTKAGATDDTLAITMRRAVAAIVDSAEKHGITVIYRGIGIGWSIDANLRSLSAFGPFNEMTVGSNWENSGIEHYVLGQAPMRVPQLCILDRTVEIKPDIISVTPGRVVLRRVGRAAIRAWADSGAVVGSGRAVSEMR